MKWEKMKTRDKIISVIAVIATILGIFASVIMTLQILGYKY